MGEKTKLDLPVMIENGLEIVDLVTENDVLFALVKINIVGLLNLKLLKTERK